MIETKKALEQIEEIVKIKSKAITHYTVLDNNNSYSLIKLNPETGRKHQLRKQLLIHGIPILGDSKYRLSKKRSEKKNSLMLHAYKINFSIGDKKFNFDVWYDPKNNIIIKITYTRMGNWEYRLKNFE